MHQRMDTSHPIMPAMVSSRPLAPKATSSRPGIDRYKLARLMIFAGLALFWVVVLRAIF